MHQPMRPYALVLQTLCQMHVVTAMQPVSFLSLAVTAATGGALMLYYDHLMKEKLQKGALLAGVLQHAADVVNGSSIVFGDDSEFDV